MDQKPIEQGEFMPWSVSKQIELTLLILLSQCFILFLKFYSSCFNLRFQESMKKQK